MRKEKREVGRINRGVRRDWIMRNLFIDRGYQKDKEFEPAK